MFLHQTAGIPRKSCCCLVCQEPQSKQDMHAEDLASTLPYILWAAARTRAVVLYAMVSDPKEPCTASYMPWAATQTRITHRRMCHVLRPKQEPCAAVYVMGCCPNKTHALPYMPRAAAQTRIALYVMGCGSNKNHALPRVSQGQRSTNKTIHSGSTCAGKDSFEE